MSEEFRTGLALGFDLGAALALFLWWSRDQLVRDLKRRIGEHLDEVLKD